MNGRRFSFRSCAAAVLTAVGGVGIARDGVPPLPLPLGEREAEQPPARPLTQPPASRALIPATPADAIARLRLAYAGEVGERVDLRVGRDETPGSVITLRLSRGASPPAAVARIDLPDLSVSARVGRVVAARPSDVGLFVEWAYDGPLTPEVFGASLPPLALPQIAIVFGDDSISRPTPFGSVPKWELVAPPVGDGHPLVRCVGTDDRVRTELVVDPRTDRLTEFTIAPVAGRTGVVVHGVCTPMDPGNSAAWEISTDERRRVKSLNELASPPSELGTGDHWPDVAFQGSDQKPWTAAEEFRRSASPGPGVLVLFRPKPGEDPALPAAAASGLSVALDLWRLAALQAADPNPPTRVLRRPVFVRGAGIYTLGEFSRDHLGRVDAEWTRAVAAAAPREIAPPPDAQSMLWAPTGVNSIDRLAPDARAVLVVIDHDLSVRAVIRLDGREPVSAKDELSHALEAPEAAGQR